MIGNVGRKLKGANSEGVDSDKCECGTIPHTKEVVRGSRGVLEMVKDAISIPHELIAELIVPIDKNINQILGVIDHYLH